MARDPQIKVLIVDDDPAVRLSLAEYLSDYSFDVTPLASPNEALNVINNVPFDMVIVDLSLQEMDSEEFILQVHGRRPGTGFLIYTGSADYRLSDNLKKIGMLQKQVLLKPVPDLERIVDIIKEQAGYGNEKG